MGMMEKSRLTLLLTTALSNVQLVSAHPGQPIAPHDFWSAWNNDFFLLLMLEITTFSYLWGVQRIWLRAGVGKGISIPSFAAFIGAGLALIIALVSPLDALSNALFSAHMLQHLILVLIVAPLLILSQFPLALLWILPRRWAQILSRKWHQLSIFHRAWKLLINPMIAWLIFALIFWIWHAPLFYQAALHDETIHAFEHFTFLLSATLFWWILLNPARSKPSRYGIGVLYLTTTGIHSGILGALMTFTIKPWYTFYSQSVIPWGLTPMQDQQLAGLLMWLPGGTVFMFCALWCFAAWLRTLEQHTLVVRHFNSPKTEERV
jgi:putative membrane protein